MNLHKELKHFEQVIELVAEEKGLPEVFVEKDYFVSLLLKRISEESPEVIFKGGTSLSKCYGVINRFSEDIDINIKTDERLSGSDRKNLKNAIIKAIEDSEMTLKNPSEIRSGRDFNKYIVEYKSFFPTNETLKEDLIVETYLSLRSFPHERKLVNNYIFEYLHNDKQIDLIKKYDLNPFEINVQSMERTFFDKLFAICDYYERKALNQNSRHLYDIHQIWTTQNIQVEKLGSLFYEIVEERRKKQKINISCRRGYELKRVMSHVVNKDFYKSDYQEITEKLLFGDKIVEYETVKISIQEILESGIIPNILE